MACEGVGAVAGLPLLLLDVPLESAVELALARALVDAAPESLVTIPFGDLATLDALETLDVKVEVVESGRRLRPDRVETIAVLDAAAAAA